MNLGTGGHKSSVKVGTYCIMRSNALCEDISIVIKEVIDQQSFYQRYDEAMERTLAR